jgi:hypothetical protein
VYILFMNVDGTVKSHQTITHGLGGGPTLGLYDAFGSSVASLGDVDGDGVTDIAVGASEDDTGGEYSDRGAVYVMYLNADGTAKSHWKIAHETNGGPSLQDGNEFGSSVASLGDLDGDGITDLAVGAIGGVEYGIGDPYGTVHILFLKPPSTDVLPQLAGDYNIDGLVDAADYVVWRKSLNTPVPPYIGADGSGNGNVDQADHHVWSANFGAASVPDSGGGAISDDVASAAVVMEQASSSDAVAIAVDGVVQPATLSLRSLSSATTSTAAIASPRTNRGPLRLPNPLPVVSQDDALLAWLTGGSANSQSDFEHVFFDDRDRGPDTLDLAFDSIVLARDHRAGVVSTTLLEI